MKRLSVAVHLLVTCLVFSGLLQLGAQSGKTFRGKVADASGALIPGATVTITDLATNKSIHTVSGKDGQFELSNVPADAVLVVIEKNGFASFTKRYPEGGAGTITINASLNVASLSATVVVSGTVDPEAKPVPTREDVMLTPETLRVLDRQEIEMGGPMAGGAQMVQNTPGANVVGYGQTGATKYTIILNGIQQGWAGENQGFTEPGSLGITFDGIPVADAATGLWQSATLPQDLLIQDVAVTYGPGQPAGRWYNDAGGSIEFTPVQPTLEHHLAVQVAEGPYGQQNFDFVGNTGNFKGWKTVLGGGLGRGDDFRVGPDGFANPAKDGSVFGKTLRSFSAGSIALGVYYAKAGGYRAQIIPTSDQGLVVPTGVGVNTMNYSQPTSGFLSSLPFNAYNKYDTNEMFLSYLRENLNLSSKMTVMNTTWYNHIRRLHRRGTDALNANDQVDEYNNPHSDMLGDQADMTVQLPMNKIDLGGFILHEAYNTRNLFYNPAEGGNGPKEIVNSGAKFRDGYFQHDNVAFYAQDDFYPTSRIHILPSLRLVGFSDSYSNQAYKDFNIPIKAGVIPTTHCSLYAPASDPFANIFGAPSQGIYGNTTKDQGSYCAEHASDSAVEPAIDASYMPKDWLTIYGGYETTYRSPALGGGGGMFQSTDPTYYILAESQYAQIGGKVHFTHAPILGNMIVGGDFYHMNYKNQELDYETAAGVTGTDGGNSIYKGVDLFFDADPASNIHFTLNYSGEKANYSTYVLGNVLAACGTPANPAPGCTFYNGLPVSYVPSFTLNTSIMYGVIYHDHEILEPRFWIQSTGSQYLWSNLSGGPTNTKEASFTVANLSIAAPLKLFKQEINLELDVLNLANAQYNQNEYISSGGYFSALCTSSSPSTCANGGYINAYPGAPRAVYGSLTYHF